MWEVKPAAVWWYGEMHVASNASDIYFELLPYISGSIKIGLKFKAILFIYEGLNLH